MPESTVNSYIPEISFRLFTRTALPNDHILDTEELQGDFYGAQVTFLKNDTPTRYINQWNMLATYFAKTAHLRDLIVRNQKTVIRNIRPQIILECNQRQVLLANVTWGTCTVFTPYPEMVSCETQTDPQEDSKNSTDSLELLARVSKELEKLDA